MIMIAEKHKTNWSVKVTFKVAKTKMKKKKMAMND